VEEWRHRNRYRLDIRVGQEGTVVIVDCRDAELGSCAARGVCVDVGNGDELDIRLARVL
jgi:hypothetical protein